MNRIHFIGIGGIGMSAAARIAMQRGYHVSGCDLRESSTVSALRQLGCPVSIGHSPNHIHGQDTLVYSSAIRPNNPELKAARASRAVVYGRGAFMAGLMAGSTNVTVTGSHGKTTTTWMITAIFMAAGLDPTTAIGGKVPVLGANCRIGNGQFFISEADESDGSFLEFTPDLSVITNIDREHMDFYQSVEGLQKNILKFMKKTRSGGKLIINGDDVSLKQLAHQSGMDFIDYGILENCACHAEKIKSGNGWSEYTLMYLGSDLGTFRVSAGGQHTISNSLAAVCAALCAKISPDIIRKTLADFQPVSRRFEIRHTTSDDITIVDDYAHHPTEIQAVLSAAIPMKKKRIRVAFQPHRYSRTRLLIQEFARTLSEFDEVVLTDIYAAGEDAIPGVSSENLLRLIQQMKRTTCRLIRDVKDAARYIAESALSGDLIICMGAGDIKNAIPIIADQLSKRKHV